MKSGLNLKVTGQTVLPRARSLSSLSHLCASHVVAVVLAALLQHVPGPRQPLEDAGSLPHRHLLYPLK